MRAFKVYLNGKKLCLAGIGDHGVLSAIVDWVDGGRGADLSLHVGGLISSAKEHVHWIPQKALHSGDEIRIRIVEADSVDTPISRYSSNSGKDIRNQKAYVRAAAKQLGWTIQARAKKRAASRKRNQASPTEN